MAKRFLLKKPDSKTVRKVFFYMLILSIAYLINRRLFLMGVFITITLPIKFLKTMVPIPITPEPVVFFPIVMTLHWGIQYSFLYLLLTVIIFDLIIGRFGDPTIVAFFLILGVSSLGVPLSQIIPDTFVSGMVLSFIYMIVYILFRTRVLGIPIFDVLSPAISCFIFNFLYLSFFSTLLNHIM
ncbi:MAG: hypothetical protein V1859_07025 [archaeon]